MWMDPVGVQDMAAGLSNAVDGLVPTGSGQHAFVTAAPVIDAALGDFVAGMDEVLLVLAGEVKFLANGAAAAAATWLATDQSIAGQLKPK